MGRINFNDNHYAGGITNKEKHLAEKLEHKLNGALTESGRAELKRQTGSSSININDSLPDIYSDGHKIQIPLEQGKALVIDRYADNHDGTHDLNSRTAFDEKKYKQIAKWAHRVTTPSSFASNTALFWGVIVGSAFVIQPHEKRNKE